MYDHPFVAENIEKLNKAGVHFVMPDVEEGKAKLPEVEKIVWSAISLLASEGPLAGKSFIVTAGRTVEYIDPIRLISNNSSGKMGVEICKALLLAGAEVELVYGKGTERPPSVLPVHYVETAEEMNERVQGALARKSFDGCIASAAVGDWRVEEVSEEKISTHSRERLSLDMVPTVKIIDLIKENYPDIYLVAFRALYKKSFDELSEDAAERMKKARADLIAVNDVSDEHVGFESESNEMRIFSKSGREFHIPFSQKFKVAERIVEIIAQLMNE